MSARCRLSLPSIRAELGASLRQAGWLLSTVNLVTALGGMAIALTADRLGHRRLIIFGTALCLAASLVRRDGRQRRSAARGCASSRASASSPSWSRSRPLLLRIATPRDQRLAMAFWTTYMPAGAGSMMLIAALVLPGTSWRWVWWIAGGASAAMLLALLLRGARRHELDPVVATRRPVLAEMAEVATSGGPLAIARLLRRLFLLLVRRDRLPADPAGRAPGLLDLDGRDRHRRRDDRERRRQSRRGLDAAAARAARRHHRRRDRCRWRSAPSAIFVDGVPDLCALVLAGVYSAVIGVVPGCLFTAIPVHAPRPQLVGAATGLLMQVSNLGALLGPPITAALVSAGGWPAAAWLTSVALGIAALAGLFLHWREKRKLAA